LSNAILSPEQTAGALPYSALAQEIAALLQDPTVAVPPRIVQALHGGGSLFVMPAADAQVAITKLISFIPGNAERGLPTIQGDIVVFDVQTGQRVALLDGPTVTARRTAAVSLLAAQQLAPRRDGPMLIVGAGVQGQSHLEAFHQGLGVQEVWVASRSRASADALVAHAHSMGLQARRVDEPNAALADCPLVVSTTPAQQVVLTARPRSDAFVAAVGAFTPRMVEWSAEVCQASTWPTPALWWWTPATPTTKPVIFCKRASMSAPCLAWPMWWARPWLGKTRTGPLVGRCFSKAAAGAVGIWRRPVAWRAHAHSRVEPLPWRFENNPEETPWFNASMSAHACQKSPSTTARCTWPGKSPKCPDKTSRARPVRC